MGSKFVQIEDMKEQQAVNRINDVEEQKEIPDKINDDHKSLNKYQALFTQINVMLGMGPLILPSVFYESGAVLSSLFLILMGLFSFICAEFLVESMSICNYIQSKKNIYEKTQLNTEQDIQKQQQLQNCDLNQPPQNQFELYQKFEYGQMAEILINRSSKFAVSILIILYLIGVAIMKCMATAQVLSKQFQGYDVIGSYNFWLITFFLISALFSFKNVQDTKQLQSLIFYVRISTVFAMLIGCFYVMSISKIHPLSTPAFPLISFHGFNHFFSNSVFAFNMHHSLPSMVKPIEPSKDIKKVFQGTFGIAFVIFFSLCFSAIFAFGDSLVGTDDLKLFNYNFKESISFVYYLAGFYVFLNITAFPVMTITSRNNLLSLIPSLQEVQDSRSQQQQNTLTLPNIIGTVAILLPVFLFSIFAKNIQVVLNVIGGIFGAIILTIIPPLLVLFGRRKLYHIKDSLSEMNFFHRTIIQSDILPLVILIIGLVCCIYNIYLTIHQVIY